MPVFSTACPRNCYSTCSFKVHVEDGKVVHIDPHSANRATPEGVCLKGLSYIERANSPDRILYPLKRKSNSKEFEQISWDEALTIISEKLVFYKAKYGSHSILYYTGSGMMGMLNSIGSHFWKLFGGVTTQYGSLCWSAGLEATRLTLGENKHNAPWITENASLIVVWGKNIAESNIQEMIPIEKAQAKGAKLVVIDTRRTPTAERADLLIQPTPGTDAVLALAVANILIEKDCIDHQFIEEHVLGFELYKEYVKAYTPKLAAEICEIPIEFIELLAEYIGVIDPMTLICGYGIQRYTNGGQTVRAILSLAVITGNIGKNGAGWQYANLQSFVFDHVKEPLSYFPPEKPDGIFRRTISVAELGTDMLAQKSPDLKMVWVERGNPVTSNPDTNMTLKAFRALDFRIVIDQFMTDTALEADIILPAKNMFEQSDIIGSYWNPYVQLRQKVVEPAGEVKPESEIYYWLAHKIGFPVEEIDKIIPKPDDKSVEDYLKNQLLPFPELDYEKLKEGPLLPNSHEEIAFADLKFDTPSGKIELYSENAKTIWKVHPLPSYDELLEGKSIKTDVSKKYPLYFMTPNTKNRIHSQFNNLKIIQLFSPKPIVFIHPEDAKSRNIKHKDQVKIFNDRGFFIIEANYSFGMKRGCVAVTNGWWIQQGGTVNQLSFGRETDMGHGTAFHDNMVEVVSVNN